ncbi:MAG: S8 family serine peptidase [Pseudomonadota bacterium]
MVKYSSWKAWTMAAGACALVLAACDRTDERIERAGSVVEAAIGQATGADGAAPAGTEMASVPVDARAFAGGELVQAEALVEERPQALFAIGSIIAKPRDLPPLPSPTEALIMQSPELAGEIEALSVEEAPPAIVEPAPIPEPTGEANEGAVEGRPVPPAARRAYREALNQRVLLPKNLPLDQERMARRAIPTPRAIQVQTDARGVMLEKMSQFGLAGQVELNRTGQMVIQIGGDGADPTQLSLPPRPERPRPIENLFSIEGARLPNLPRMALNSDWQCPTDIDPEYMRANPVLATDCLVKELRDTGQFEYVEKDFIFEHQFIRRPRNEPPVRIAVEPNDPLWSLQWHFFNNGDGEGKSPGGAGFVDFWTDKDTTGSRDVVVAVVDTGLDMDHPDIVSSLNVAPGWDMVSDPRMGNDGDGRDPDADDPGDLCDPSSPFAEDSYHGTHVAGTVGAGLSNNGAGVAGGAWNVKIVPVRALGKCGGRLTDINDGIRWAGGLVPAFDAEGNEVWNENPADIINLSIGLFEFCPASLQEAINAVTERGAVVVSAAGNARVDTRFYSPGGCQNVISVAAGDARGQITPYSNYGDEVDVLAPGGDLGRDDNGDGRPDGVLSTRLATNCFDPVTGDPVDTCFYAFEQGTSMAAPHVSAALALIKSRDPELVGGALADTLLQALAPREVEQCAGPCDEYPGAEPSPDDPALCLRPCGGGLLDLSRVELGE